MKITLCTTTSCKWQGTRLPLWKSWVVEKWKKRCCTKPNIRTIIWSSDVLNVLRCQLSWYIIMKNIIDVCTSSWKNVHITLHYIYIVQCVYQNWSMRHRRPESIWLCRRTQSLSLTSTTIRPHYTTGFISSHVTKVDSITVCCSSQHSNSVCLHKSPAEVQSAQVTLR